MLRDTPGLILYSLIKGTMRIILWYNVDFLTQIWKQTIFLDLFLWTSIGSNPSPLPASQTFVHTQLLSRHLTCIIFLIPILARPQEFVGIIPSLSEMKKNGLQTGYNLLPMLSRTAKPHTNTLWLCSLIAQTWQKSPFQQSRQFYAQRILNSQHVLHLHKEEMSPLFVAGI